MWPVLLPLLGALLSGAGALLVNESSAPAYTADALLAVLPDDPAADVSIPVAAIWAEVGGSDAVVRQAARALDVDQQTLAAGLRATQLPNAPVISVSVTTTDPERAAAWANGVAAELLGRGEETPVPGYGLRQVAPAEAPVAGSVPLGPLIMLGAAAFGGVAGLVLAQRLRPIPRRCGR